MKRGGQSGAVLILVSQKREVPSGNLLQFAIENGPFIVDENHKRLPESKYNHCMLIYGIPLLSQDIEVTGFFRCRSHFCCRGVSRKNMTG